MIVSDKITKVQIVKDMIYISGTQQDKKDIGQLQTPTTVVLKLSLSYMMLQTEYLNNLI